MADDDDQPRQQISPQAFSTPLNSLGSNILILTNPEDDLYKIELMFRGLKQDDNGHLISVGRPIINDEGVNCVIGLASDFLSRNCDMSNLEDRQEVDVLRNDLAEDLREKLMVSQREFAIVDDASRSIISGKIIRTAHVSLKRAYREGTRRFIKGSSHEINQNIHTPNQEKKGSSWFAAFK